ncbi:hypothetical protein JR316_0009330 [Psilocybe cubensis]|uniref:Uncharacterized protein n=2 Tax=Psilocybe cubensis TaxID=181762 RepID=A0A8H7XX48_PSICU|nr:hypothetical protein JR316_0009330 [Psilocybe cubensis]KAH9478868.1 hypothetical protein JR316_0009330 [Psilocybe cubensis]
MVTRTRNKSKAIDIHNHNPPRIDKMKKVDPEIRQFLDMEAQVDEGVDSEEDESARGKASFIAIYVLVSIYADDALQMCSLMTVRLWRIV